MTESFYRTYILPAISCGPSALEYLTSVGILKAFHACPACGMMERKVPYKRNSDKQAWRCMTTRCTRYKKYTSLRVDSFLSGFSVPAHVFLNILWHWKKGNTQVEVQSDEQVSVDLVQKIYEKLRINCANYIAANQIMLGGPGIRCQIDESLFRYKPKNHRGRAPENEKWVFGIADCSYVPAKIFLQSVQDRSASTLLPLISRVCRPGTIVVSDEWRAYLNVSSLGFEHRTVNHSIYFVDPTNGNHTQNIESYWGKAKLRVNKMKGVLGDKIVSYLNEWMWRDNFLNDDFLNIVELVRFYN